MVHASNGGEARDVVNGITASGGSAVAARADIADENAVAEVLATAERTFGGVDVVVNAAGITILRSLVEFDLGDLDRKHRTNIRGTFVVNQLAARAVRRGGAIINFSTSVKKLSLPTHFAHAGHPGDTRTAEVYDTHYAGLMDQVSERLADLSPDDADPQLVAEAIIRAVDAPQGRRPYRVHIDPADDGAALVLALGDGIRRTSCDQIGLADLLPPVVTQWTDFNGSLR